MVSLTSQGGTALTKLLALPTPPSKITCLVRSPDKAKLFDQLTLPSGTTLTVLFGSLQDLDKLIGGAEEADVVINAASADDLDAVKALMQGMKNRKDETGHRSVFIETSGTGLFIDDARGEWATDLVSIGSEGRLILQIYTDLHPTPKTRDSPALLSMEGVPPNAPHREVDAAINEGDARGDFKSYIIVPPTIWGAGQGEIYDKGISNSFSQQMPRLIKISLDRGAAAVVGKGANIWGHVNVGDLGDLFAIIYQRALQTASEGTISAAIGHGKSGFYLSISGEYTSLAAAQAIGQAMVENKLGDSAQPTRLSEEEVQKYYGNSPYTGSNSRGRGDRSKSIGWRPKLADERDFLRGVREETVRVRKVFDGVYVPKKRS